MEDMERGDKLYTIGHSNIPISDFISILNHFSIEVLVDVRSVPFSEYAHWFNREILSKTLSKEAIIYHYMGDILGGRPKDSSCYRQGKPDYGLIREKDFYKNGIERLIKGIRRYRIAVMCSEEDPKNCHRRNLIGLDLYKSGIRIIHIRHDLRLEEDNYEDEMLMESQGKLFGG
jgi:uncharacterized protein (DUF488 family)